MLDSPVKLLLRARPLAAALAAALGVIASYARVAWAQTYSTDQPPVSIPDNLPAGAAMTLNVPEAFPVSTLAVTVSITHTWIGDLRALELIAPGGQVIALWPTAGVGSGGDNLKHTTLDGTAALQIGASGATTPPFRNRYRPFGAIPAGLMSGGAWTLRAVDGASGDVGTIDYFVLSFNEQVRIGQAGWPTNQTSATTSPSQTGLSVPIPDGDATGGAISWAVVDTPDAMQISGIDLALSVTHPSLSDLRVRLIHPSGSPWVDVVIPGAMTGGAASPVTDAAGTPNRPYITTLSDGATPLGAGGTPYRGRFAPSVPGSLSAFNGLSSEGTWNLRVFDEAGNGLSGSIREWSIHIRGVAYVPTGIGSALPPAISPGGSTELRVIVTPSAGSSLAGITSVTADIGELTGLGIGDTIPLARIGTSADWTATVASAGALAFGVKSVPFTITEAAGSPTGGGVIQIMVVPESDECQSTPLIAGFGPGSLIGSTYGATTSFVPIATTCGTATGAGGSRDIFTRFIPPATGAYSLDLCGSAFDTVLAVFASCPASNGVQLACNDDSTANVPCSGTFNTQSRIPSIAMTAGMTYFIRIAGWNDNSGNYTLNINLVDPLAPGTCCIGSACTLTDGASCAGVYTVGPGAVCLPTTCGGPPPHEHCCRGTTCVEVPAMTCIGGSSGISAAVVGACGSGNSTMTCCFADFNHDGVGSVDDLFLYFNAYFTGSAFANFGGDSVAQPTIDDLFLYINAYFIGCEP